MYFAHGMFLNLIPSQKARERALTTFDENLRAVGMLDDMRDKKEDKCRGWKGKTPAISARRVRKAFEGE